MFQSFLSFYYFLVLFGNLKKWFEQSPPHSIWFTGTPTLSWFEKWLIAAFFIVQDWSNMEISGFAKHKPMKSNKDLLFFTQWSPWSNGSLQFNLFYVIIKTFGWSTRKGRVAGGTPNGCEVVNTVLWRELIICSLALSLLQFSCQFFSEKVHMILLFYSIWSECIVAWGIEASIWVINEC